MNDNQIEELLNSTDFTDEFERQLFVMDMAEHDQEIEAAAAKGWQAPEWWFIGLGLKEAPEAVKFQAKEIYKQFLRFHPAKEAASFEELVKSFTLAKMNNRITEKRR